VVVNPEFEPPGVFLWTTDSGFRAIGLPSGADFASGQGINDQVEVVGGSGQFGGSATAFLWTEQDGFKDLGALSEFPRSSATDINQNEQVVGTARAPGSFSSARGFVWTAVAGIRDLGTLPGGTQSEAEAINDGGQVVGMSSNSEGARHAVLWTPGTTPDAALEGLVADIEALVASGGLNQAEGHALSVKLETALGLLEHEQRKAAGKLVGSFLNQIEALVRSRRLSEVDAQPLRDQATCVDTQLQ
jgi:probable HAF family extracellular repeat protein